IQQIGRNYFGVVPAPRTRLPIVKESISVGCFVSEITVARIDCSRFPEFSECFRPPTLAATNRSDQARSIGVVWQQTRCQVKLPESLLEVGLYPVKAECARDVALAQIRLQSQCFF